MSKRKHPEKTSSSKKKKPSLDEEETENLFNNLPVELKEEIFKYLNGKDVLNMSLTCSAFNDFVESNSKAMHRLVCTFPTIPRITKMEGLIGNRSISNIKFKRPIFKNDEAIACSFLSKFGDSIRELHMNSYTSSMLVRALNICKNVQKVTCESIYINRRKWEWNHEKHISEDPEPLNLPSVKFLKHDGAGYTLSYFSNCQLTGFEVTLLASYAQQRMVRLLINQNSLELLSIDGRVHFQQSNNDFLKMKFKLKHLKLTKVATSDEQLKVFLNLHRETLESLDISFIPPTTGTNDTLNYVSDFKSLKTIHLSKFRSDLHLMPNVERLNILDKNVLVKFLQNFPNLNVINATNCNFSKKSLYYLARFEKLTLKDCSFTTSDYKKYTFHENNLQYLTVDCCEFPSWLLDLIKHEDTKLHRLYLRNLDLTLEHQSLLKNAHKFPTLIIANVNFFNELA